MFRPSREGRRSVPGGDWVCICAWDLEGDLEGDLDGECARPWTSTGTCACDWGLGTTVLAELRLEFELGGGDCASSTECFVLSVGGSGGTGGN